MGIVIGLLVLSFLVFIHELGHFLAAKRVGVRVETFSIGFGPKILRKRIGETEYCLSLILFGGYVKMTGQEDLGAPDSPENDPRDFRNKPVRQRVEIAVAGPLFNYLLAVAVLTLLFVIGVHEAFSPDARTVGHVAKGSPGDSAGFLSGDTLLTVNGRTIARFEDLMLEAAVNAERSLAVAVGRPSGRVDLSLVPAKTGREGVGWSGIAPAEPVLVGAVMEGSPAAAAGVLPLDTLLALDSLPVTSWETLVERVGQSKGRPLAVNLKRGDSTLELTVAAAYDSSQGRFLMGLQKGVPRVFARYAPHRALVKAVRQTGRDALLIFKFLGALMERRLSVKSMAGPVGIVHMSGEVARGGWDALLLFLSMLSVNLAIVNLFPFLIITDGGIIFFLLLERLRGRPLSQRLQQWIQQAAVAFVVCFFLWVTLNDVLRVLGRP